MENIDQATELIGYSHKNEVIIKGKKVEFSYSKSQSINQNISNRKKERDNNYRTLYFHCIYIYL